MRTLLLLLALCTFGFSQTLQEKRWAAAYVPVHRQKAVDNIVARSPESRRAMEVGRKGRKWSTAQRSKFLRAQEIFVTPEYREKISAANKARYADPEFAVRVDAVRPRGSAHARSRALFFILPTGERVEFPTATAAAQGLEVSLPSVKKWLSGAHPWPGTGKTTKPQTARLRGLTGGYVNP